ncbi:MAG: hypothetical protein ABSF83_12730 [Nitrososphaerales archaeon]
MQKTARSIVEIQPDLHCTADIEVFLEVLGYTKKMANENGFQDLHDLAGYLYEFIDYYADAGKSRLSFESVLLSPPTSVARRVAEGLSLAVPWIGSLSVLFVFGVSMWLAWGLPISVITLLIVGVFTGLIVSEGPLQVFNRLFSFYYNQANVPEVRRTLKRSYLVLAAVLAATDGLLYLFGTLAGIPAGLIAFAAVGATTISFHRVSYVIIYALKEIRLLLVSYLLAFVTLLTVYFLLPGLIPAAPTRYIDALVSAVAVISIAPVYETYKVFSRSAITPLGSARVSSASPLIVNQRTIGSRFGIQLWETAPFYVFGTFSLVMLFGDRLLSWLFNPVHVANGIALPLVFNSVYEIGADVALMVLFPVTIVQYVLMTPIFEQVSNLAVTKKVTEVRSVDGFLRGSYGRLLTVSLCCAAPIAALLIVLAPEIVSRIGGSDLTVEILRVAAVANLLMVVFATNGVFMIFLNKVRSLAIISVTGAWLVIVGGSLLAQSGFQEIIFAYLVAAATVATLSSLHVRKDLEHAASLFFSKYV